MTVNNLFSISTKPPKELSKDKIEKKTEEYIEELKELQNVLFAQGKWSLLLILQGMDGSGKDGAVKNVFSGTNPNGIVVDSFRAPTKEDLSHDFLWRIHKKVPAKGMIQIFNRSHYEDVLVTRVLGLIDDKTAEDRFRHINNFESLLESSHTKVLKFFFHISKEEQQERFEERKTDPKKYWKYNPNDLNATKDWDKYMLYYNEVFEKCSPENTWTVVPADKNWYKEYLFARKIVETLKSLELEYPPLVSE